MSDGATQGLGVSPRTLVAVFAASVVLFAGVTFLSRGYEHMRIERAQQYFERGQRLSQGERDAQAVVAYRNALAIAHGNGAYRLALAKALLRMGNLDEASIYLNELLQADPGDAIPNLLLARIAARENRTESAVNYYHRAIYGYWRENALENRLEARWELIGLLNKSGSRNQILAELLQVADQEPNNAAIRERVARRLLENDSPAQAAELFREVLRQQPRNADALAGYGEAQFALGRYITAQSYLHRAVREQTKDPEAKGKLDQVNQILALDPMVRGLSPAERYQRSRTLVERTLAALDGCLAGHKTPLAEELQLAAGARKLLEDRRRPRMAAATEINFSTAEDLWAARASLCGARNDVDQAVARVMANMSR